MKTLSIICIVVLLVFFSLCSSCAEQPLERKTPLGITIHVDTYHPDFNLTDTKYLAICDCAGADPDKYLQDLVVKIVAPGSEEIPFGKRPEGYTHVWGSYQPWNFTCLVNEDQTALAHEFGHYLEQQLHGFSGNVYSHTPFSLPMACGNPIDSEYNKKVDAGQ